jgi:V-type H+-transporting ATPase subunit E
MMDDEQSAKQIQQMVNFILNEAKDKAEEIDAKTLEDFNIEKLKAAQTMKDKIRVDMDKQRKKIVTGAAIARSTKVNQSRLQKIEARQQSLMDMTGLCEGELKNYARDKAKYQPLIVDLIVQGCLRLMEDKVLIRCKKEDEKTVGAVLEQAAQKYSQTVKRQTNADKKLSLSVDSSSYLPPTSAGGVICMTTDTKIKVDNTLDTRLSLVMANDLPNLRKMLFPAKK